MWTNSFFARSYVLGLAILISVPLRLCAEPAEAVLSMQTANGQETFHIGERIPLK